METTEAMVRYVLQVISEGQIYYPDIVCLPEVFATSNLQKRLSVGEIVQASVKALDKQNI